MARDSEQRGHGKHFGGTNTRHIEDVLMKIFNQL